MRPFGKDLRAMASEKSTGDKKLIEEMTQPGSTPELFSPPTATWAEDAEVQVPEALQFLEGRGVAFTIVPRYTWNNDGPVTVLKKQLSVTFQVDTVVTSNDIVFAFDEAGIGVDVITSIQRKNF